MPHKNDSLITPFKDDMLQLREEMANFQAEVEATIGQVQETLYALRNLNNSEPRFNARYVFSKPDRCKGPN